MRIGIHTSTSGALQNAALKARDLGANCFQIFSGSPRMWRSPQPKPEEIRELKRLRAEHDLAPLLIHTAYLVNLASPDETVRAKSIAAFRGELERAAAIGAEYLVLHPGSGKDRSAEWAIERMVAGLARASKGMRPGPLTLLLENTAGAGATLGRSLEQLKTMRELAQPRVPYAVEYCLDTCHLFAAGYDVASAAGLRATVEQAEAVLGLGRVPVIHANDSLGALHSRLDRHANIGAGLIGREGFRRILNDPELSAKAFVLETPVDNEGDDQRNVDALKSLCRKSRTTTRRSS